MTVTNSFDDLAGIIRSRRTHMLVDRDREVSTDLIEELIDLGTWAPNHKRTWPWKFAIVTGDGRARLGAAFADDMDERDVGDLGKRAKTRTKYTRTPLSLVVACEPHDNPTFHAENRDAVAAAIQTILLGATARGLASFWGTAPLMDSRRAQELCGFEPDDRIIAILYLGWPNGSVEAPDRPVPLVTRVTG